MLRSVNRRRVRAGFTLVELLVVIAIIAFLAALLIMFFPSLSTQTSEANGAVNFQGWLNIARQKAIRNNMPYGLRLWIKDPTTMYVTGCSYIEQPDDFRGGLILTRSTTATGFGPPWNVVQMGGVDPTGGFADPTLYPVQPGDYIEVLSTGLLHQVLGVNLPLNLPPVVPPMPPTAPPITPPYIVLSTPIPTQIGQFDPVSGTPLNGTSDYRILRQARPLVEESLDLPTGVVIDLGTNVDLSNNNPFGAPAVNFTNLLPFQYLPGIVPPVPSYVDILFGPSGAVLTQAPQPTMNFWVRSTDTGSTSIYSGTPTIIAVFTATGRTGAYPPAPVANAFMDVQ